MNVVTFMRSVSQCVCHLAMPVVGVVGDTEGGPMMVFGVPRNRWTGRHFDIDYCEPAGSVRRESGEGGQLALSISAVWYGTGDL